MSDDEFFGEESLFQEPQDYYQPPPEAHSTTFERQFPSPECPTPTTLTMHLVGKSPLWGHLLWNAGKATTDYIDKHRAELVTGKTVLELGAGAGLPSIVSSLSASKVVVTDYPDPDLLQNLEKNRVASGIDPAISDRIAVEGYIWGESIADLTKHLPNNEEKFDFVILSDLVFNHTEHHKLLKTSKMAVKPETGRILVVFSPHRPKLFHKDLEFFDIATSDEYGFEILDKFELDYTPMFEEDDETKEIRGKVFGYLLKLP
ncbi:hypothetical protein DV495_002306 [Geotrichum candidum]|uniref:Protein N-terminal and lysine N-methyltransferase EFM7 n=1 Tax=Geotrichum candidum TaxID=1173061 RepID=A0A0J9XG77_GEOCN|nr:hypothetical protein DV452_004996 [Geotrichum candidum]KAI9214650.1 hypothetical protein DS838_000450 [Geotrichum bryndzae]KAF5129360.1 hypothetical protein DV495_002306 [Geotrichum candidum]KAF7501016.1 hypothetical protein DV113_000988 [Geotrichum candidum]KAI8134927.1 hypothetical protein DUD61_001379 [Geotrichum candidum]